MNDWELILAVQAWEYRKYSRLCSGCYDVCLVLEMAVDSNNFSIYDRRECSLNTCVAAYARRSRLLWTLCPGVLLSMFDSHTPFIRHAAQLEYVRRLCDIFRTDKWNESNIVSLSQCCLPSPFSLFYQIQKGDTWGLELVLDLWQQSKGLLIGWHNIELFSVPPTRLEIVYAARLSFWNDFESLCWFLVLMALCLSYFVGLLDTTNTSMKRRVCRLTMLAFVRLISGAFFRNNCYGVVLRYSTRMPYESNCISVIGPLGLRCWTLAWWMNMMLIRFWAYLH